LDVTLVAAQAHRNSETPNEGLETHDRDIGKDWVCWSYRDEGFCQWDFVNPENGIYTRAQHGYKRREGELMGEFHITWSCRRQTPRRIEWLANLESLYSPR
jgi:hypothetical protein